MAGVTAWRQIKRFLGQTALVLAVGRDGSGPFSEDLSPTMIGMPIFSHDHVLHGF